MIRNIFVFIAVIILSRSAICQTKKEDKEYLNQYPQNCDDFKNVVLIVFDDLRSDALGCYGGNPETPNIDAFAKEAYVCRNAIATAGLCSPSRATLMTGKWGHQSGVDDNLFLGTSRLLSLDLKETTFLEWAREKDYLVGYYGKWHLGPDGPIRRGVHRFPKNGIQRKNIKHIFPSRDKINEYYRVDTVFDEKPAYYATIGGNYQTSQERTKVIDGIKFLEEAADLKMPFLLTIDFNGPHPPYHVPSPYNKMYNYNDIKLPQSFADKFNNKPWYQRENLWYWLDVGHMSETDWKKTISYHNGLVSMLDRMTGELFEAIKRIGFWDNTLIVLVADQGSMLADHRLYDKGPWCYDELMKIPLILKVPGKKGGEIQRHVSIIDINETLVDWMGLEPDNGNRFSNSILSLINKDEKAWNTPDEAFYRYEWYNGTWFGIRSIRTHEFKFNYNPTSVSEFYDLKNDPHEVYNKIDDPKLIIQQQKLEQELLKHLLETKDPLYQRFNSYLKNKKS